MDIHWFLVPAEGRFPWKIYVDPSERKPPRHEFIRELARAIDYNDYDGALLATGPGMHDAWSLATAMAQHTQKMKFIVAQHPGVTSPLLLAQQATTFQQLNGRRLILNVINGDSSQGPPHGLMMSHDDRYALADEYWGVWKRIMAGERVSHDGRYLKFADAQLTNPLTGPLPELYFGGSSEAAIDVAAKHVDTYLSWGEPPPMLAEKISAVRKRAAHYGRTLRFGLRINLLVRETKEEAWAAVDRLYAQIGQDHVANGRRITQASDSEGVRRLNQLIGDKPHKHARDLELYPDLWAGLSLVFTGPISFTIVGDPETVANRIAEYRALGIDAFIFSSFPLLEEAYRVSDLLIPLLRAQELAEVRASPVEAVQRTA